MHPGSRRGQFAANCAPEYTQMPFSIECDAAHPNERQDKLEDFERSAIVRPKLSQLVARKPRADAFRPHAPRSNPTSLQERAF
jgi:hypothetical protein